MVLIQCWGMANGEQTDAFGQLLKNYDPDFMGGLGRADWTHDASRALKFDDHKAALEFYRQTSRVKTTRPDGRPNRPLTAFNLSFITEADL